jgi:prepilin-type N-terminal cleavage/methylation domain-containing protein/prepilin-type processing-associated H-X9-DG protein
MMPTRKNRRGFTLVEILVVVLIIVILMGLLFPAIQAARENARAIQCINNQQELGKAISSYALNNGRLPRVLSFVNPASPATSPRINWVISILGDLGRMDLWRAYSGGTGIAPVNVGQLICPSSDLIVTNPVGGLSYAVNMGAYQSDSSGNPDYSVRIFRNRAFLDGPELDQNLDSIKSLTRTVMLSESIQPGLWNYAPAAQNKPSPYAFPADLLPLAFQWPPNTVPPYDSTTYFSSSKISTILSSNHRGMINVTFFDGHTEKIPETTYTWLDPDNQLYGTP